MDEGHAIVGLVDEAFAAEAGEEAADGFAGEAGHAAELFLVELHVEGDGEAGMGGAVVEVIHAGPVEEGAGELAGGGGVESEAACGEDGAVVLARHGESDGAADVGVGVHEADELGARDGFDDGGDKGFGGDAIEGVFAQGGEAEDIAGAGDAEEEEAAFGGGGGDFDAAAAEDEEVAGGEAFAEEGFMGIAKAAGTDGVEVAPRRCGELAEGLLAQDGTVLTVVRENGGPPGSCAGGAKAL